MLKGFLARDSLGGIECQHFAEEIECEWVSFRVDALEWYARLDGE